MRLAALKLLAAGDDPEAMQFALDEALKHSKLRDIVWYLAMHGFGAYYLDLKHGAHELASRSH